MTTLDSPSRKVARDSHIDLAGTAWPLYKLEAVAVGLVVLLVLFLVTATAQTAVLSAAAAATVVWWARRAYYLRA
ncbi:hypothetical protein ACIBED_04285 [Rhodococcus coprophilus]|uniref:Uncharacterized protein n=1 Tax=Rhodococcus coprophilus TaxID=38310 RepID=A0A2X4WN71_9NOCA|nr:hypothetical protein [Rhodococcus coprophilus]MBM7460515.1 putative membrane protein YqjE [Rhodococcus coprophilus]SQI28325.1 Uncharacterised protein [Rhodococcus coprophilus]